MTAFSIDNLRDKNSGSPDRVDALVWGLTELFDKITSRPRKARERADGLTLVPAERFHSGNSPNTLKPDTMWMSG